MAETATETRTGVVGALLGLHALTSLHPGSGTALGTVDLPVQRERHTGWPTIPGSAIKGVLRDACRERIKGQFEDDGDDVPEHGRKTRRDKANEQARLVEVFGPPSGRADEQAGALSVTDARLLAFPVRSLRGLFAWVTCAEALNRLQRDAMLAHMSLTWRELSSPGPNEAHVIRGSPCLDPLGKHLVLEEYEFTVVGEAVKESAEWIGMSVLPSEPAYAAVTKRFPAHCVLLNDDDFTHFARHATEITARVGLNYETKTARDGALFYQEFLPAETIFYSVVLANSACVKKAGMSSLEILNFLRPLPRVLQLGGDETTGKGYCATRLETSILHEEQS